jgi:peptidoglycan/LPS O-acetylase OafA/YrhL
VANRKQDREPVSDTTPGAATRIEYIDALRSIAALSVLFAHIAAYLARQPDAPELAIQFRRVVLDHFDLGLFGVALFFFISGFVVPFSLLKGNGLREFWIHRTFRLYPPFWFSLIAIILVEGVIHQKAFSLYRVASNATMVPQLFGASPMSGIYWTLFVEMIFYLLCSVLYAFRLLGDLRVTAASVIILSALTALPLLINAITGTSFPVKYIMFHLSFLFSGTLVRLCLDDARTNRVALLMSVLGLQLLLAAISTGVMPSTPPGFGFFTSQSNLAAYAVATVVFLLAVKLQRPSSPNLVRLGRNSYSLYLLHWPVIAVMLTMLPSASSQLAIPLILFGTTFSMLVAELSFRLLERPCIRMGRYLGAKVSCCASN